MDSFRDVYDDFLRVTTRYHLQSDMLDRHAVQECRDELVYVCQQMSNFRDQAFRDYKRARREYKKAWARGFKEHRAKGKTISEIEQLLTIECDYEQEQLDDAEAVLENIKQILKDGKDNKDTMASRLRDMQDDA